MVINQYHSIGDILFCEPIFKHFLNKNGAKPIVPIHDHLFWLGDYIDSALFVRKSQFQLDYDSMETSNPDYLPLRFANQILRNLAPDDYSDFSNAMPDKYNLVGLDPELWKTLDIKFDPIKASGLFRKLNLSLDSEYILINENSQAGKLEINPDTNLRVIKMREIPGYTVLDWSLVMFHAKENHHVSTSTFYILEALKYSGNVFLYPRPNDDGLQGISKLNPSFKYTKCE